MGKSLRLLAQIGAESAESTGHEPSFSASISARTTSPPDGPAPNLDHPFFPRSVIATVDKSWQFGAACQGLAADIFYPQSDEQCDVAKTVCASCPVRTPCLEYAITVREKDGVWGGANEKERRRIIRQRRRAAAKQRALVSAS